MNISAFSRFAEREIMRHAGKSLVQAEQHCQENIIALECAEMQWKQAAYIVENICVGGPFEI